MPVSTKSPLGNKPKRENGADTLCFLRAFEVRFTAITGKKFFRHSGDPVYVREMLKKQGLDDLLCDLYLSEKFFERWANSSQQQSSLIRSFYSFRQTPKK